MTSTTKIKINIKITLLSNSDTGILPCSLDSHSLMNGRYFSVCVIPDNESGLRMAGLRIFHTLMVEDVELPLEEAGLLQCVGGVSIDPALLMGMRLVRGCSAHLCR